MQFRIFVLLLLLFVATLACAQDGRRIREIEVRGNTRISTVAITTAMRLKVGQTASSAAITRDQDSILNLGFFKKVQIFSKDVGDAETDLLVDVEEYPVVKEILIEGNTVIKTEVIREIVLTHQQLNEIWNNRAAPQIVADVRKLYEDAGFFAEFEQLAPADESPNTLSLKLLEAKLGEIRFIGLNRTKESTVRRIMKSKSGDAFNLEQFRQDMTNLFHTNWFEDLRPERKVGETPSIFDFDVTVKEARTAIINAGVALDPQSRLVGTISATDSNFRGSGQNVGLFLSQATVGGGPSAEFGWGNPFFDDRGTSVNFRVFSKIVYNFTGTGLFDNGSSSVEDRFDERRTGFSVNASRPIGKMHRASLGLLARNAKTIDLSTTNSQNFIQQDGDLITLQFGYDYNSSFPVAEPVKGEAVEFLVEPGFSNITKIGGTIGQNTELLGQKTFVRSSIEVRKYFSKEPKRKEGDAEEFGVIPPRPVVALRARYGVISGTVPFFEQLFVGGADSLRGYENQRFWGSQSFLATAEYRHPVQRSFNLVGFVDYGGAWDGYGELNNFSQSSKPNFHLGYGAGLAFRTPMGPIRIDFAWNETGGSRTHFSFATSF